MVDDKVVKMSVYLDVKYLSVDAMQIPRLCQMTEKLSHFCMSVSPLRDFTVFPA